MDDPIVEHAASVLMHPKARVALETIAHELLTQQVAHRERHVVEIVWYLCRVEIRVNLVRSRRCEGAHGRECRKSAIRVFHALRLAPR